MHLLHNQQKSLILNKHGERDWDDRLEWSCTWAIKQSMMLVKRQVVYSARSVECESRTASTYQLRYLGTTPYCVVGPLARLSYYILLWFQAPYQVSLEFVQ